MKYKVFEHREDNIQRRLNFHKKKSIRAISNAYLATSNTIKDCSRGEIFLFREKGLRTWHDATLLWTCYDAVGTNEKHTPYSEGAYKPPEEQKVSETAVLTKQSMCSTTMPSFPRIEIEANDRF